MCVCIHIYIYKCCGVINWAKFGHFKQLLTGPSCFVKNSLSKKHYKNRGFNRFFRDAQFLNVTNWANLFFWGRQLGPVSDV